MTQTQRLEFLSPVARIVMGHPMKPTTTNMQGQPLVTRDGKPTQRYELKLAIAKNDPEWPAFYEKIFNAARAAWPQFFNAQGQVTNPNFSMKIQDGDGADGNGQSNAGKPGHAGHWILKVSSSFAPRVFYKDRYNDADKITDENLIKTGDWVRVHGSIESNNNPQKPGLYVNLGMVALWFQGDAIVSGPNAAAAFGAAGAGFTPPGATALPTMAPGNGAAFTPPVAAAMPGMPPMPGAALPGSAPAAVPSAPAMLQPTYVAPNNAIMGMPPQAAAPVAMPGMPPMPGAAAAPAMPPMPPAGPVFTMTPAANGFTREQMHTAGWSDDQLIASGMMTRQG